MEQPPDPAPELIGVPPVDPAPKPTRAPYGSKCSNGMSRIVAGRLNGTGRTIQSGVMTFKQGRWPRGSQSIKRDGDAYRAILEKAAIEIHGEIGPYAAGVIQTAVTLETSARLWQKWLRDKWDTMKEEDKDRRLAAIGKARQARDQCLRKIGLDKGIGGGDEDAWKEFWKARPAGIESPE